MVNKEFKFKNNGQFDSLYGEAKKRVNMTLTDTALNWLDAQIEEGKALNRSDAVEKIARGQLGDDVNSSVTNDALLLKIKTLLKTALELKKKKKANEHLITEAIALLDELED